MIFRLSLALMLLTGAAHAADFDRTVAVNGPADLFVSTSAGRVQIVPADGSSIHVRAHIYADSNAGNDAEQRVRQLSEHPPIQQSGNSVRIGDVTGDRSLFDHITIDYQISVPRSTALYLHTGSGDIEVDNVGRSLKADTGSGSVRAHSLAGPADLHTGSGDIELQEQAAGDVKASTGSGSIRVFGIAGSFQAATGSGDIEVGGHITGPSHLKTGSGSVRLHLGQDARLTLDASTGSGTVRAPGFSSGGQHSLKQPINGGGPVINVQTGSGDIEVN